MRRQVSMPQVLGAMRIAATPSQVIARWSWLAARSHWALRLVEIPRTCLVLRPETPAATSPEGQRCLAETPPASRNSI